MKMLGKYALAEDLKKLDTLVQGISQKTEKHSNEIKSLYDLISQLQRMKGGQPVKGDDLGPLTARVDKLEASLAALRKQFDELRSYINQSLQGLKAPAAPPQTPVKSNSDDLERLQRELEHLARSMDDRFDHFLGLLDKKADKIDLENLEKRFNERLNDIIRNFIDRFADKKDTMKRLSNIEKQIKALFDLLMNQESTRQTEDDAMFTKKPLGGVSCASCAKDITNLSGQIAEYQPWKRLPFKEPGERISRYGPGFSKILQMLRPERSIETVEIHSHLRKNMMNNSVEEIGHDHNPFLTSGMTSPQGVPSSKHYDHLLPKTVSGAESSHHPPSTNARTTVNFFKSSIHQSGNPTSGASRDSHRGLGGGWNG